MTSINTRNVHEYLIIRLFIHVLFQWKYHLHTTTRMKYVFKDYYQFVNSTWCERKYRKHFQNLSLPFSNI